MIPENLFPATAQSRKITLSNLSPPVYILMILATLLQGNHFSGARRTGVFEIAARRWNARGVWANYSPWNSHRHN